MGASCGRATVSSRLRGSGASLGSNQLASACAHRACRASPRALDPRCHALVAPGHLTDPGSRGRDALERRGGLPVAAARIGTAPTDSYLDFTTALTRLNALIDEDPRAALEKALAADPLRVAERAQREICARGALVLVDTVVVGTYASLLAPGGLEELSSESLQLHVSTALCAEQQAPFEPEVLAALECALGCSAIHATRAAELIRELEERERAPFVAFLRNRSQAFARLWPSEAPTETESNEAHMLVDATTLLREILASAFRG